MTASIDPYLGMKNDDAPTYAITHDTSRDEGKKIILAHLFGRSYGSEAGIIVEVLTGIGVIRRYARPEVKKLAGRVRGWLRQLAADGLLDRKYAGSYVNMTSDSVSEMVRRKEDHDATEKQAKADRVTLSNAIGSLVKSERYGDNAILTPEQLRQVVVIVENLARRVVDHHLVLDSDFAVNQAPTHGDY